LRKESPWGGLRNACYAIHVKKIELPILQKRGKSGGKTRHDQENGGKACAYLGLQMLYQEIEKGGQSVVEKNRWKHRKRF